MRGAPDHMSIKLSSYLFQIHVGLDNCMLMVCSHSSLHFKSQWLRFAIIFVNAYAFHYAKIAAKSELKPHAHTVHNTRVTIAAQCESVDICHRPTVIRFKTVCWDCFPPRGRKLTSIWYASSNVWHNSQIGVKTYKLALLAYCYISHSPSLGHVIVHISPCFSQR